MAKFHAEPVGRHSPIKDRCPRRNLIDSEKKAISLTLFARIASSTLKGRNRVLLEVPAGVVEPKPYVGIRREMHYAGCAAHRPGQSERISPMATRCGGESVSCDQSTGNGIHLSTFVTGAAGFIGSNCVDRLLNQGDDVVGYDNLSTGVPEFIASARRHKNFTLVARAISLSSAPLRPATSAAYPKSAPYRSNRV